FDLTVDGNVALDQNGTIKLHGANGDLKRPDSAQAKANVTFLGANLSISLVSIGTDEYMTNPISGSWEKAPSDLGYDPAVLFNTDQGISHVIRNLQDPKIAGTDTVNGKDAYHITGTVKKSDAQPIAGGALNSDSIPVELWVDKQTNDVVKLVLHDSSGNGGNSETTWTLLLTKQNESVTINKPNV
ncbi:MAG: LppX_LprAFG lipoprotein, partial [Nitrolancea sp.]